jgi:hypothetical protein
MRRKNSSRFPKGNNQHDLIVLVQASGEGDQLGDLSTISDPAIVEHIIDVVKKA